MIKETNIQKSVVMPKELANKIAKEAEENFTTFNQIIKKILIEYFKNKE